jgi:hypothetical protein
MTRSLERAFARAAKLPEAEQEALAELLLAEMASEERWVRAFASSQEELAKPLSPERRQGSRYSKKG